jgi:hypothetical protein
MLVRASGPEAAAPLSSSDKAEDLKKGAKQAHQAQQQDQQVSSAAAAAASTSSSSSSPDAPPQKEAAARSSNSSSDKPKASKKVPCALVWIDLEMTGQHLHSTHPRMYACMHTRTQY